MAGVICQDCFFVSDIKADDACFFVSDIKAGDACPGCGGKDLESLALGESSDRAPQLMKRDDEILDNICLRREREAK